VTLPIGKQVELKIAGKTYKVTIKSLARDGAEVEVNGKQHHVDIHVPEQPARASAPQPVARHAPRPANPTAPRQAPTSAKSLNSLMPGVVIKILVKPGQQVAAGDVLLVLEAMKMENEIRSDRSGTIGSVKVSEGQQVQTGDPLVSFT
jgi:biotin carboxyl carrier protein